MFRSQTDEHLAAKWDPKPYHDERGTGDRWKSNVGWEDVYSFAPRVECIPSRDPLPRRQYLYGTRHTAGNDGPSMRWDPRPEFARPPVNRILYDFRLWVEREGLVSVLSWYLDKPWGRGGRHEDGTWSVSDDEIEHARKVLTRLAALS